MSTVAIVDYGTCNLDSVKRAVEECGGNPVITSEASELERAARIILPGVGAFPAGMRGLAALSLVDVLREQVGKGIPLLGLCLGMQLLATVGREGGDTPGLGLINGEVRRLDPSLGRVPHVGWNEVHHVRDSPLFAGIPSGKDFYFVHSYAMVCADQSDILAETPYCGSVVSVVQKNNVAGVQFHPEKSRRVGFQLLTNFLSF